MSRNITTLILIWLIALTGCEPVSQSEQAAKIFTPEEHEELVVAFVIDLSGSFYERMAEQGHAYRFLMEVTSQISRTRPGKECRLILAQISGSEDPLLWEGYSSQIKHDFGSEAKFREFLESKADQRGSRVVQSLGSAIEYICQHDAICNRSAKSAILVLSDMIDSSPDPAQIARLREQLNNYQALGGAIGLYFVGQDRVAGFKKLLAESGFVSYVVESEIVTRPSLPNFY